MSCAFLPRRIVAFLLLLAVGLHSAQAASMQYGACCGDSAPGSEAVHAEHQGATPKSPAMEADCDPNCGGCAICHSAAACAAAHRAGVTATPGALTVAGPLDRGRSPDPFHHPPRA